MPAPAVKGFMPLCFTPRSRVCDEQGVGQFPMWKRFDSIRGIVNQYIDEPYRNFLALPYHEVDKLKAEEIFYWYTPRCDTSYTRMNRTGDDYDYYKQLLDDTVAHYRSVVSKLKREGKMDDANFLELSLKYAGDSEDDVYCGDGRVVATVWGMRPRQVQRTGESKLSVELAPELEMHTVRYDLGSIGSTQSPIMLKKCHGSKIHQNQVPQVTVKDGYQFTGWNNNPVDTEVTEDLLFVAQYRELPEEEKPVIKPPQEEVVQGKQLQEEKPIDDKPKTEESGKSHHVRFLTPDSLVIKELNVEHGKRILPGYVPQLPLVDGVLSPAWNGDPLNDVIISDRDYQALKPEIAEKPLRTVRFLAPDGSVVSQTQVVDGEKLSKTQVPPLPVVNGKICPSWDADPLAEAINADHDFTATQPQAAANEIEGVKQHTVRFLNSDGSEVMRTQVPHGQHLQPDQIPSLPTSGGNENVKWSPNPMNKVIKHDTDFIIRNSRSWHWPWTWEFGGRHGFWRWLLYIILFLLLVFLVLYIMYLNDPCSR